MLSSECNFVALLLQWVERRHVVHYFISAIQNKIQKFTININNYAAIDETRCLKRTYNWWFLYGNFINQIAINIAYNSICVLFLNRFRCSWPNTENDINSTATGHRRENYQMNWDNSIFGSRIRFFLSSHLLCVGNHFTIPMPKCEFPNHKSTRERTYILNS